MKLCKPIYSIILMLSILSITKIQAQEQNKQTVLPDSSLKASTEKLSLGFELIDKDDLAINVTVVDSSQFNKGFYVSPLELIVGKVPGLQISSKSGVPGGDFSVNMRGITSFGENSNPLIIIDNVLILDYQIDLNSNDIASFVILKSAEAGVLYGEKAADGAIIITTKKGSEEFKLNYTSKLGFSYLPNQIDVLSGDEYREIFNEQFSSQTEYMALLGAANTNWQDQIYQSAISQEHYVSVSGGKRLVPFRISLSNTKQKGILKTSEYERSTASLNLSPSLFKDHLKINLSLYSVFNDNRIANEYAIRNAIHFDPSQTVYADNEYGDYFTWYNSDGPIHFISSANPLALLELTENNLQSTRIIGNINLDYKLHFFPDIHIGFNYGMDHYETENNITTAVNASWLYRGDERGWIEENNETISRETRDLFIQYSKEIKSISSKIDLRVGLFALEKDYSTDYSQDYLVNPEEYSYGQYSYTRSQFAKYARLNYMFKNKFILNISIRDEASSTYANEFNQLFSFLSAFKWKMKNEAFLSSSETISDLNLRISYGKTAATREFTQTIGLMYDPYIEPEKITSTNLGVDFGLYQNKIYGSIDYYSKKVKDLQSLISVFGGSGYNYILTNSGSIKSTGLEFKLNSLLVSTKNLRWSIGLAGSIDQSEMISSDYFATVSSVAYNAIVQVHTTGYSPYTFYVFEQVYNTDGKPIEGMYVAQDGDGNITNEDRILYKNPSPDFYMGINSHLKYKDWDFSFSGRLSLGNYVYNNVSAFGFYDNLLGRDYLLNAPASLNNTQFISGQYYSSHYVENASYFKMDNIRIERKLGNLWKDKLGAGLALSIQNAFIITKYEGLDPEVYNGIDSYSYPRARTISLELNVDF